MKILVENSGYHLGNLGDVAMLIAGLDYLAEAFDGAELFVVSDVKRVPSGFPTYTPIPAEQLHTWYEQRVLPIPSRSLGATTSDRIRGLEQELLARFPGPAIAAAKLTAKLTKMPVQVSSQGLALVRSMDAVVSTGGGFVNDSFPHQCTNVLETLWLAQRRGIPTAMFGQGLGPLSNPKGVEIAKRVFPNLKVLSLREGTHSPDVALRLGVRSKAVRVTGDDAIKLVDSYASENQRADIGFNVRLAKYSGLNSDAVSRIANILASRCSSIGPCIRAIPIDVRGTSDDDTSSAKSAFKATSITPVLPQDSSIEALVSQVSLCRVVITASYHAAVFSLTLGIPVIGISKSEYYDHKFSGLAQMFAGGVELCRLQSNSVEDDFTRALEKQSKFSVSESDQLRKSAARQVNNSQAAYLAFREAC